MPAIAPIEDLRAAQKELLETSDINELKKVFKKYRRIGWKNICKLWLEESTPERLKGEGDQNFPKKLRSILALQRHMTIDRTSK
jgi:hypothetical protein